MEWTWVVTTTIPVLTFIAGLWWNRVDGDRREQRAARAAAAAAFEQLQRGTHLELQDVLAAGFQAAGRFSSNEPGTDRDYGTAFNRANILASRIANSEIRETVSTALMADKHSQRRRRTCFGRHRGKRTTPRLPQSTPSASWSANPRGRDT
jgi:hypothetical protein